MRYLLALSVFMASVVSATEAYVHYDPSHEMCYINLNTLPKEDADYYGDKIKQRCTKRPTQDVVKQEVKLKVETPAVIVPENNPFIDECVSLTMNRAMCYELWVERSK